MRSEEKLVATYPFGSGISCAGGCLSESKEAFRW